MEQILTFNNFSFNGEQYLQLQVTAMGTRIAPSYANLFMADLERELLTWNTLCMEAFHRLRLRYLATCSRVTEEFSATDQLLPLNHQVHFRNLQGTPIIPGHYSHLEWKDHSHRSIYQADRHPPTSIHGELPSQTFHHVNSIKSEP